VEKTHVSCLLGLNGKHVHDRDVGGSRSIAAKSGRRHQLEAEFARASRGIVHVTLLVWTDRASFAGAVRGSRDLLAGSAARSRKPYTFHRGCCHRASYGAPLRARIGGMQARQKPYFGSDSRKPLSAGIGKCSNFPVFAGSEARVVRRCSRKCLKIKGKMNPAAPLMMVHGLTYARAIGILAPLWVLRGP
jgi:hypothetical protein